MAKDTSPSISVNKLGEYIVSRGNRQREILRDRKFPTDYKGMYYRESSEAIASCLASSMQDTSALARTMRILEQMTPEKVGTQRRINANIDAIEIFDGLLDSIEFHGGEPELGPHTAPRLTRHGVQVSVRPEIVLRGSGKNGQPLLGGVKLHFSRTRPLNDESAGYVSAVVQEFCREKLAGNETVHAPYCFVIDLGSNRIYPGVKSTIQRMKDVEAECRNIAGLWPTIERDE